MHYCLCILGTCALLVCLCAIIFLDHVLCKGVGVTETMDVKLLFVSISFLMLLGKNRPCRLQLPIQELNIRSRIYHISPYTLLS